MVLGDILSPHADGDGPIVFNIGVTGFRLDMGVLVVGDIVGFFLDDSRLGKALIDVTLIALLNAVRLSAHGKGLVHIVGSGNFFVFHPDQVPGPGSFVLGSGNNQSQGIADKADHFTFTDQDGPVIDEIHAAQIGAGDIFPGNDPDKAGRLLSFRRVNFDDAGAGNGRPEYFGMKHAGHGEVGAVLSSPCYLVDGITSEGNGLMHGSPSIQWHIQLLPGFVRSPCSGRDCRPGQPECRGAWGWGCG